ncbi:MAG TPA: FAD-binding oxidoreductase [Stellaceae bacterium]|nr:FAD-binding oxidoreductase [Stellaceae bacterium]
MNSPVADTVPVPRFYDAFAPAAPAAPPLEGGERAAVAIVGAGFTGLSTALHLAERGIRALVLEAKEIGWGASSRNFGQLVPYFKHDQEHVLQQFGAGRGERLIAAAASGPDLVFDLIERHGIQCSVQRNGLIFAAHSPAGQAGLERRTAFWQARGAPVEMLAGKDAEALIGTPYYAACSLDRRGGTINPLAYVRGLAASAAKLGATLRAQTPVTALSRAGGQWRLKTPRGEVTAETVVLATNAYTERHLWPGLRQSLVPMRAYQFASKPLSENVRRSILPQNQPLTDTRHLFSGVRLHADGRLQASADGPAFDETGEADPAKVRRRLLAVFPQLGSIEWEYRWAGWVAMTYDQYPHLHALAPGLWAGLGYSGRGIALATRMGSEIAARIAGVPESELAFPATPLQPRRLNGLARPLVSSLMAYYRVQDALADRRRRDALRAAR